MEDSSVPVCRLCFDEEIDPKSDPLLRPCLCSGSMAYIHQSCLYEQRVSSFSPQAVTTCGICRTDYRTVDSENGMSARDAQRAVWHKIIRFVGIRIGVFFVAVFIFGFLPKFLLPQLEGIQFIHGETLLLRFADHMSKGACTTFTLSGGWAVISVMHSLQWIRIFTGSPFGTGGGWTGRTGSSDKGKKGDMGPILMILVAVGAIYLLWQLVKGVWDIMRTGNAVAGAKLHQANREMRVEIAKRYVVIDLREEWAEERRVRCHDSELKYPQQNPPSSGDSAPESDRLPFPVTSISDDID